MLKGVYKTMNELLKIVRNRQQRSSCILNTANLKGAREHSNLYFKVVNKGSPVLGVGSLSFKLEPDKKPK